MTARASTALGIAAVLGLVHAGASIYWGLGGDALLNTVGQTADRISEGQFADGRWLLVLIGMAKAVLAMAPALTARRPGAGVLRPGYWLGATALIAWGAINTTTAGLLLLGVLPRPEPFDSAAAVGHALLWDPLFLAWGVALAAGMWLTAPAVTDLRRLESRGGGEPTESAAVEDERAAGLGVVDAVQLKQDDDVVTGLDLAINSAIELRETVIEGDSPFVGRVEEYPVESLGHRTGELAAEDVLMVGEHGDPEMIGATQIRPGLRGVRDRHRHQRRIEADTGERARGQTDHRAVDLRGHRDDAGGEDPERLAKSRGVEVLVGSEAAHACTSSNRDTTGAVAANQSAYASGSSWRESTT